MVLADGREVGASVVLGACDPYRLMDLLPDGALPAPLGERMAAVRRPGTTLKLNLALTGLPRFSCLPADAPSPFGSTIHLLPGSASLVGGGRRVADGGAARHVGGRAGRPAAGGADHRVVPAHHRRPVAVRRRPGTTRRRSSSSRSPTSWPAPPGTRRCPATSTRLIEICERYAPGTGDLIADAVPLPPPGIEAHFGITGGHIHHVDNTVSFTDRMPYATGVDGVYAGSAGCHPAGSVIGAAGHNAARRILTDLGPAP